MDAESLLSAPFLTAQRRHHVGDLAGLAAMARTTLPAGEDAAWQAPLPLLRQARNREWLRIGARALSQVPVTETLRDLSQFADAAIEAARACAAAQLLPRFGTPRGEEGKESRLIVLGMGKLGGYELNYSSDIDLICAYTEAGETDGARALSNGEYFVKLVQEMVKLLGAATEDGFVFRVDLMLRPFGSASPVAISAAAMEDYYQNHGREWERYALVKARPVAGDLAAGEALLARLRPFVYRRYLDYDAINALRDLKQRIAADAASRGVAGDDLKVGVGGIRECEFIVQSYQLVRGGHDARLRRRGWRETLQALMAQALIAVDEGQALEAAYDLLRRVENAVQIWGDQQTHALPETPERQAWLAAATGFADWPALYAALTEHRAGVARMFGDLFAERQEQASSGAKAAVLSGMTGCEVEAAGADCLAAFGDSAAEVQAAIASLRAAPQLRAAGESTLARLNTLLPLLLEDARTLEGDAPRRAAAFTRALHIVAAVLGRSTYLTLLRDATTARRNLLAVVAASPAIAQELARHPVLLDQLLDARTLYTPPMRAAFRDELLPRMAELDASDVEQAMNLLRQEVREARLRIAAASAVASLPLVKVSDGLTWLAEAALEAAIRFAWRAMQQAHGQPQRADGQAARFAAIGYGKLGALEMGFGSDLDLVFLHDAEPPEADTVALIPTHAFASGRPAPAIRPLPQSTWMGRLAQKILGLLTTQTHLGRAYEVDLQLRPNGSTGLPVVTLAAFTSYQNEQAWTWEHQALTRARFVAGDERLGAAFAAVRLQVLCRPRDAAALRPEIANMREKMRAHLGRSKAGRWDIKHGPGGLVDVEFLVAYWVLLHAHACPEVVEHPDIWRQSEALAGAGLLSAQAAEDLLNAQRSYRSALHERSLQGIGSDAEDEAFLAERATISALWQQTFIDAAAQI